MAIHGYTKNYKLIKPQFNTDTWHDYIYDNLDTIDAIMSAIYASGNWQGFWQKNTHYDVGDVVIDKDTDTMYKVLVEHTTSENTFALEQAAHPTYYELWSPNNLAESWAIDMDGLVSSVDYSSKAYAISSALIDAGSAKEWAIETGGTIGTTGEYSAKKHANDAASSAGTAASEASDAADSATLSQKWAVDANLVASTDYSSKSWATGSLDAGSAKDWAIKEGGQVGTTGKYSAKVYSLAAQNHYEKAVDWASKTNGLVEGTDYSAKAYAISEGLISDGSAKEWSNKAKAWATSSTIIEDGKYGASYYALQAYNANVSAQNNKTLSKDWATKMDGQVESTDYSSKYYAGQAATSAQAAQDAVDEVHGLIATPIGTIFQSVYVDESLDIARQLNGQLISSTKFTGFRDWLDTVQTAIPNLFTDEATWQSEKALSKFGQVGKFVIDDENQTIRLPAVVNAQGLLGLSGIGSLVNESLPNITGRVYNSPNYAGFAFFNITDDPNSALYFNTQSSTIIPSERTSSGNRIGDMFLDASRSSSTYQDNAPVQQEAVQYPYYIQVATGIEESLPAIREYKVNNSDYFGKSIYSDIAPDNASWLASNGSYNARAVYPDYYDWLNSKIGQVITANGGKVVLSTGTITDYDFVVNQNDQTFRLPLLNGEEDLRGSVTESVSGAVSGTGTTSFTATKNGWLSGKSFLPAGQTLITFSIDGTEICRTHASAGEAATIEAFIKAGQTIYVEFNNLLFLAFTPAVGNGVLYYYVGDTVQDSSLINAGAVLGQLSNKADIDASNFNASGKSLLSGLGMPSSRYIDLTLLASGQNYTAPANGYFSILGVGNTTPSQANPVSIYMSCGSMTNRNTMTVDFSCGLFIPAKKGQSMYLEYRNLKLAGIDYAYFRFVYAEGEE